ncbi:MAG: tRNA uridine-5-carboxymethylaminomethyl(34) synthesis enzyme MnmG [Ignavibacteria bacterium]|nr:tRNA uridine-5-carboxymethylaminomethyl(34) synthesis enzyme MnmG [Ignavibacteria bacterium]
MNTKFDILVIGGGHAGIEASCAAAKLGLNVGLVSMDFNTIGRLSCNPSIGGNAKGHLAKEIDAIGGVMPIIADASGIQFKTLNTSKGPAVWSPRSQNDKDLYPLFAQNVLKQHKNLTIIAETITEVLVSKWRVFGVKTANNEEIMAKAVILCSGTFLNAVMWTGIEGTDGGRVGERPAHKISDLLESAGLQRGRLKTGTPPRIHANSIDYSKMRIHDGDAIPRPFSLKTRRVVNSLACFATLTTNNTHDILREGFDRSPMFTGLIHGAGPRYCPSIEDKIFRFADKSSHHIVLEPEGLTADSVYVNGFSTSLPVDIQERGLKSIPGLESCEILKHGYAVEYDFFFPYQLHFTMETKAIQGLYFAGQINGTSGYEEAASQGLIAGINAALEIQNKEPFTLKRSEAYIGVMIDDLVNKSTEEPYRIFTSLAEYRLLLRTDTAYDRLLPLGHSLGLISDKLFNTWERGLGLHDELQEYVTQTKLSPEVANPVLINSNETEITESTRIDHLTKRPDVSLSSLMQISNPVGKYAVITQEHPHAVHQVETAIRYEGYIQKQQRDVDRFAENEAKLMPLNFDYTKVRSLSKEAIEKLTKIQPGSLGQASRIPGVSASDVSILAMYLQ